MKTIKIFIPHLEQLGEELIECLIQTLQMSLISGIIAFFFGIVLGVILIVTKKDGLFQNRIVYGVFDKAVDLLRSIPFIILMVLLIPVSRAIVGTGSGVQGAYVPLIIGTVPFFARQIESVLSDVDRGLVEASEAMGFSPIEIIISVYLKESINNYLREFEIELDLIELKEIYIG